MKEEAYKERLLTKSIPELKTLATKVFNAWIRERDKEAGCISCPNGKPEQAGHFFSGGHNSGLRYNTDNVHGQCTRCNLYLSGNLLWYEQGILKRIGKERVHRLKDKAAYYKRNGYKHSREVLIDIIIKYR